MKTWWMVLMAVAVGCGSPTKKETDATDPVVICTDDDCEDATDDEGCGFATCNDQNECTLDYGTQDPLTCVARCTYELAPECTPAPGETPQCSRSCLPPQDECITVAETVADNGCVIGCEYRPVPNCPADTPSDDPTANNETPPPVSGGVCDPSVEGSCSNVTPYCIDGTCRECVGAGDCAPDELCIDNGCTLPPNCSQDSSACPTGYDCVGGACEAPVGKSCDSNDPTSCPEGLICDPGTNACAHAGGDLGCGFCNPDCTCDNGLTCSGFFCEGCSLVDPNAPACPEGMLCLEFIAPICLPLGI